MIVGVLGIYGWRHRTVPGALPFAFLMFFATPWALGAAAETAAIDVATKISWIKLQVVWLVAAANASLWFAVEYANLGRWVTRRALTLLAIPAMLLPLLVITNDTHHLIWNGFYVNGNIRPTTDDLMQVIETHAPAESPNRSPQRAT